MKLSKLSLENVCQFEKLTWDFRPGITGVIGPNGAGKSNALNVACYAGLTGDFSRHVDGKSGMIRQQAPAGAKSSIHVVFEHAGTQFEVIRGLQAPVGQWFRAVDSGAKFLTKAADIQHEIEDVLGINRRLIDSFLFVEQHSLFSFLSDVPSERAKAFAQLCGTAKAEMIWGLAGARLAEDASLVEGRKVLQGMLDQTRARIGECKAQIRKHRKDADAAAEEVLDDETVKTHHLMVQRWEKFSRLQAEGDRLSELLKQQYADAVSKNATRKRAIAERDEILNASRDDQSRVEQIVAQLALAESNRATYARREKRSASLAEHQSALRRLVEPDCPSGKRKTLVRQHADLMVAVRTNEAFLKSFSGGVAACPTCGTPATSLSEKLESVKEEIPKQKAHLAELSARIAEHALYDVDLADYRRNLQSLEQKIQECRDELAAEKEVKPLSDRQIAQLQGEHQKIRERAARLAALSTVANTAVYEFSQAKAVHQQTKQRLAEIAKEKKRCKSSKETAAAAREALSAHEKASMRRDVSRELQTRAEGDLERQRAEFQRQKGILEQSRRAQTYLDDLKDVRDEVMHRDKLPLLTHRHYLAELEGGVNDTLALFNSPFTVQASDDLSFIASMPNGTVIKAAGLSGGQKVMLAMAYRLTVNKLFASQVSCMVLDEPSDGLDAENRELAADVFQRLGRLVKSRYNQVVIITHDEALERSCDQRLVVAR